MNRARALAAVPTLLIAAVVCFWLRCARADALLALGRDLQAEWRLPEAAGVLEQAAALRPGDTAIEDELALCYKLSHRVQAHAALVEKILRERKRPDDRLWIYADLAQDELALGDFQAARRYFALAKSASSVDSQAYIREGYADLNEGRDALAEEDFRRLVALKPADFFAYQHLGAYLDNVGRLPEAETALERALKMQSEASGPGLAELAHTILWLAYVLREEGKSSEAEGLLASGERRTAEIGPGPDYFTKDLRPLLLASHAGILADEGRRDEAGRTFDQALAWCRRWDCDPGFMAGVLTDRADLLADEGRAREALTDADQADSLSAAVPADSRWGAAKEIYSYHDLGSVFLRLGESARAERYFRAVIERRRSMPFNPQRAQAETSLAGLCAASGRRAEALSLYQDAARVWERHGLSAKARQAEDAAASLSRSRADPR